MRFEFRQAIGDETRNVVHLREIQLLFHVKFAGQLTAVNVTEEDVEGLHVGLGHVDPIGQRLLHAGAEYSLEVGHSVG